ncbi:hypothetical protein [Sphingobacterium faecale]|uniref:Uncharacterized protein n=1 Tax=Sphingobacterium faecale TaxID=2803775 RepID=A0ABS1RAM7_9SPHI|nr:hypothetical protein [Sphingobacterium faecale]MBL1411082.1 hypothetical protein [Sphingobacterium faecale]
MIKSLFAYVFLLIGSDLLINVAINKAQGNPGEMIMIALIVRVVSFVVLFSLIGVLVLSLLRKQALLLALGVTSAIVYVLIPVIIYFLKESSDQSIWGVYAAIHTKSELFIAISLPYLLACCASLLIVSRRGSIK